MLPAQALVIMNTSASDCTDLIASAHTVDANQIFLFSTANRIFGQPRAGISVYELITSIDPQNPPNTVYVTYRDKLLAAAEGIAQG